MIAIRIPGTLTRSRPTLRGAYSHFCLTWFGYVSRDPRDASDGLLSFHAPVKHWGEGNTGAYCQLSGEWFPASRLRTDYLGRVVGDIYYQNPGPMFDEVIPWQ